MAKSKASTAVIPPTKTGLAGFMVLARGDTGDVPVGLFANRAEARRWARKVTPDLVTSRHEMAFGADALDEAPTRIAAVFVVKFIGGVPVESETVEAKPKPARK